MPFQRHPNSYMQLGCLFMRKSFPIIQKVAIESN